MVACSGHDSQDLRPDLSFSSDNPPFGVQAYHSRNTSESASGYLGSSQLRSGNSSASGHQESQLTVRASRVDAALTKRG